MRLLLVIFVMALVGCDNGTNGTKSITTVTPKVEPDTRPSFLLDPSKPFIIDFGRGSGLHGLDIVRVDHTGAVTLSHVARDQDFESTSIQLPSSDLAKLVDLVNTKRLTTLDRTYSDPRVADGTQWVLWIEQSPSQKSIYFNNVFPGEIAEFASGLDALLSAAGLDAAQWTPLSKQQAAEQQIALWERIKPDLRR